MTTLFADTFYFFAIVNPRDTFHDAAVEFSRDSSLRLVTTAWVLTEVADGLAARNRDVFSRLLDDVRSDPNNVVVGPAEEPFEAGIALYESRPDKEWSLTDCISFVVMRENDLTDALTGDHHFEQAGFRALLK